MRKVISSMLAKAGDIQVVGVAANGLLGVEEARRLKPDVVTLDIEMPQMDGLTALPQIRQACGAAVLMVSSLTTEGSSAALAALRLGAADFIAKDVSQVSLDIVRIEQELIAKVRAIAASRREAPADAVARSAAARPALPVLKASDYDVVAIGSSTGGPPVLETLVGSLPAEFPLPVVIAQHMPAVFTKTMSESLAGLAKVKAMHGENGMPLLKAHVYVGQGGAHVRVHRAGLARYKLEISPTPRDALYKPCVNELFRSAAEACGKRVLAIVLTGMGDDGLEGARVLHAKGATILAQDHASCVVYGMPKAVTQAALVTASLNPQEMAQVLSSLPGRAAFPDKAA